MAKLKNNIPQRTKPDKYAGLSDEEKSEKAREWLEENMPFKPFGYEW